MTLPKIDVKKILYATDLSENARLAFAYAVSLANCYRAGLTILHVIAEQTDLEERIAGYVSDEIWAQIKQRHFDEAREALIGKRREGAAIRDALGSFCQSAQTDGSDFQTDDILVERGQPAERILKAAAETHCDLIVMGRHGYSALKDALMGGTARQVLKRATVPVLLVKIPED
jgi:nucleotide-binding universal stress UspA family protein